jgi:hypothetical protein
MERRPFIYYDGTVDPNLFFDSENHLRDEKGNFPSSYCSMNFCTLSDCIAHKSSWHDKGGIYARWIDENGKEIDNRPWGWTKQGFCRLSCKPREPPEALRRLTVAEAKSKIPLSAYI